MKCFDCESGRLSRKAAKVPHEVRGLKFEVEDSVWVCNQCGAISIPPDRLKEHGRLVNEAYRRLAGILSVEEIKAARHRLRMSQRQFAEYLGVGEASVKRWETGVLPDKSSSDLIRLKTDPEAALENYDSLCQRLGVTNARTLSVEISLDARTPLARFRPGLQWEGALSEYWSQLPPSRAWLQ